MALSVKQLNGDASFLLTLEPIVPYAGQQPFRILLDPWIAGPSIIAHSKFSTTRRADPCISSLQDLPEPEFVIISQDKPDHCHEPTLKQLARTNTRTLILAEPVAAKLIRSWKYFPDDRIVALERWEDPRLVAETPPPE
ncbi:hypothetical protein G7046_g8254 [Stylonectria norvegica]|nr:hypothetical protein G7046_g8254 [Stylonectria norvegica]